MLYGTSYVATGIALRSLTPLGVAATRGALGALLLAVVILFPVAGGLRLQRLTPGALGRLAVLAVLGGPAFIIAMNLAVAASGATITAFVAGLYAVLAALFGVPLLRERLNAVTIVSLGVALLGTALLGELDLEGRAMGGIGIGLVAAVLFGLFLVLSRRWSSAYSLPGQLVGVGTLGLTAVTGAILIPLLGDAGIAHPLSGEAALAIAWLALAPGALAAVLVVIGMRRLPAGRAAAFLLLNPPTAAVGGWLLLGERLSALQLLGAALVLGAIAAGSGALRRG